MPDGYHRWSGWPGAICLDCFETDPIELCIGTGLYDPYAEEWMHEDIPDIVKALNKCPADPEANNPLWEKLREMEEQYGFQGTD